MDKKRIEYLEELFKPLKKEWREHKWKSGESADDFLIELLGKHNLSIDIYKEFENIPRLNPNRRE